MGALVINTATGSGRWHEPQAEALRLRGSSRRAEGSSTGRMASVALRISGGLRSDFFVICALP